MRVELVGGLGIGKSTLCRNLGVIGFNCIHEDLSANPFLADSFESPRAFRFPSQMYFAISTFYEIKKQQNPELINILDQGLLNVRAYSKLMFRDEDKGAQDILAQCFDYVEAQTGQADLIVHLTCSPLAQMERIRDRGREHERNLSPGYIAALNHEIGLMVTRAQIDGLPVLTIDTEAVYLPDNMAYAEQLARQIAGIVYRPPGLRAPRVRRMPANDKTPLLQYIEMAEAM